MEDRKHYVEKMQATLAKLEVKTSLAKLELGDAKDELIDQYDKLHDELRDLRGVTGEQWSAMKAGFETGWKAFRTRYDEVLNKNRKQ